MSPSARTNVFDELGESWWMDDGALNGLDELTGPLRKRLIRQAFATQRESPATILDIGSGGGHITADLGREASSVVALDPSVRSLRTAIEHLDGGSAVAGVGERLPFADASFDAVLCMDVLEHVDDPGAVVAEAARVLRPGGMFVYSGPQRTLLSKLLLVHIGQNLLGLIPRGTHEADRLITPVEMDDHLVSVGIEPVHTTPAGIRLRDLPRAVLAAVGLLLSRITHPQAGRRIRFSEDVRPAFMYVGWGIKPFDDV